MIQFSRLRLHGFKSFVERTELEIGPGLTGIVGPNGCGKSNLVEALRWSMGEASSKRMRGGSGSMEDVIFNGTAQRPARKTAEVSVVLDNSRRTAPSPHNDCDEIEVVRKIERDQGSSYRINGKAMRARDVQLLYADILSGANSPYLVSQGKVTNMIQSRPHERRMILEEAAGISGLYARRHEAELRLRATDSNLKRLDDLVGSMETRLYALKKQARQATRYRNLSAQIRQLEVMIAALEWQTAHEKLKEIENSFAQAENQVAENLIVVTQLTKTQNVQAQDLPELRHKDAEMGAALQALRLELQRLEDEQQRLTQQADEAQGQMDQARIDANHEKQTLNESTHVLERLEDEDKILRAGQDHEDEELKTREDEKSVLDCKVKELEAVFTALMEETAASRSRRQSLEQQVDNDSARIAALNERMAGLKTQLAEKADSKGEDIAATLRAEIEKLETEAVSVREKLESIRQACEAAQEKREEAEETLQSHEKEKSKLDSEINTLQSVLEMYSEDGFKPVLDEIRADKGFETALSKALGDSLLASTDEGAMMVWQQREIADLPALPAGVDILEPHVKAPGQLRLALSQIGVVDSEEAGHRAASQLKPGQSVVSSEGAYWRWDGLYIKAGAADRHAVQLQQKNKLLDLQKQLPALEKNCARAKQALDKAREELRAAQEKRDELQNKLQELESGVKDKRIALGDAVEAESGRRAEIAKLEEGLSLAQDDLAVLKETIATNKKELEKFDDRALEARQEKIDAARADLNAAREKLQIAIRDCEIAKQEQSRRKARVRAIGDERVNLQNRCIRARERIKELEARENQLKEKIEELKKRPKEIKVASAALLDKFSVQEKEKGAISDKLAACEAELADTTRALKEAEALLATARERRAHAQATAEERRRNLEAIGQRISEKFDMAPEQLSAQAAISDESMPDLDELKRRRESAVSSRDAIGPVNLRADVEAEELEKQLTGILNERNDLLEAIAELRQGIQKLNREARERLQIAFGHVNAHFREMFTRLFNGGQAYLELIESDDPLEAGLEIFAQPPGKALQSLSLLSGGEQTLTAIALIFAMFLTNPAPICVLDEVDAPLDDANVDRFCDMLEEFAEKGATRFLVITHHRLTMARMDRLYGVTMAERGVSQLVSVDLNQQLDFLDDVA